MNRSLELALYVLLWVIMVVAVDFAFLRHHFWQRLIVNIAIALVFVIVYFAFLRHK